MSGFLLAGGGEPESMRSTLDAVQSHYDTIRDLKGDFVQTSRVASLGTEDVARGKVTVQRPGKMRWEYEQPEARILVIDGETLRLYSPQDRQLQIAPLQGGNVSPTALSFLLGNGVLSQLFDASRIDEAREDELGLRLRPREESGFEYLELWVDAKSHELRESVLVDLFGNRTRVRFSSLVENAGVGAEDFSIRVPDDTDILDLR